jgi:hypothetical protein
MAERNSRVILIILSSFLFLLALGLSLFLVFYKVPAHDSIQYYLSKCDNEINGNQLKLAEDSLTKATTFTKNRMDWSRVIKRAYLISELRGEWNLYYKYSERAVKLFQGQEEFWAYYLTSLIWTGQYDDLAKYESRISEDKFPTIKAEMRLIKESLNIDDSLPPYAGVMELLEKKKDAEFYELIGSITDIDGLKLDAAMLWMGLEDKDRALKVISDLKNPDNYAQILGNIYWDNNLLDTAMKYYEIQNDLDIKNHTERWTLNSILGDGYLLSGDWEKADYHYLKSLEINKDNNWRPLINRSLLHENAGIFKTASQIIFEAIEKYGDQREVVLYFLDNWRDTYPVRAERIVSRYLMNHPGDVDVLLAKLVTFPEEITPEKYHAFLWNLFNENSKSESITRYLLWYMIGLRDFESLNIIMERHSRIIGYEPDWFSLYRGVELALERPPLLEEAERELLKYYNEYKDEFGAHNLSVIYDKMGKLEEAESLRGKIK